MDIKIKKKLVKNWFISLQEIICSEIIKIEKVSGGFVSEPFIFNKNLYVLRNGSIVKYN